MKPDTQRPASDESIDREYITVEPINGSREARPEPLSYNSKTETDSLTITQSAPASQKATSGLTGRTLVMCPKGHGSVPEGDKCPFGFKRGEKYMIEGVDYDGDKLYV